MDGRGRTGDQTSSCSRNSSLETDFDEEYFSRTYVPLSHLPTPPPSDESCVEAPATRWYIPREQRDSPLLGPAIHLANLIPTSLSLTTPSVPLLHAILQRANLATEVMALGVLILDSLSPRFSMSFRSSCPLSPGWSASPGDDEDHEDDAVPGQPCPLAGRQQQQHIDALSPLLLPLSALITANKFLDDRQTSTKQYAEDWGLGIWSCAQLNFAQRCVLADLGYRLLELWQPDLIDEATDMMQRAKADGHQHVAFWHDAGAGCTTPLEDEEGVLACAVDDWPAGGRPDTMTTTIPLLHNES